MEHPIEYSVLLNGEAKGPFGREALQKLAWEGKLTLKTLVWEPRMDQWAESGTIAELLPLFAPPPLPAAKAPPPLPGKASPPPLPPAGNTGAVEE